MTQKKTYTKGFDQPDERRNFERHGYLDIVNFGEDVIIGRAVFQPGWRWSNDVKTLAGTSSCEEEHTGYCLQGTMTIRMNDGQEFQITPGQAFHIPPGHDAWVVGNEPVIDIDVTGMKNYAKRRKSEAA